MRSTQHRRGHAMTDVEYRIDPEEAVAAAIDAAEEIDDPVADEVPEKPPAAGRELQSGRHGRDAARHSC